MPEPFRGFIKIVSLHIRNVPITILVKRNFFYAEIMLDVIKDSINHQTKFSYVYINGH